MQHLALISILLLSGCAHEDGLRMQRVGMALQGTPRFEQPYYYCNRTLMGNYNCY